MATSAADIPRILHATVELIRELVEQLDVLDKCIVRGRGVGEAVVAALVAQDDDGQAVSRAWDRKKKKGFDY